MKILSCTKTIQLAKDLATGIGASIVNRSIDQFSDGELNIQITDDLYQQDVMVIHELYPDVNVNLLQLLFLINAAKRKGAKRVHAIIPYFAYSRMDHKKSDSDFITASCIASLLETAGLETLITIDLHSSQIEGFFRVPVKNISMLELFKSSLDQINRKNTVVVSPDMGGKVRSTGLSKYMQIPLAVIYKQRDEQNNVSMSGIMGDVAGKHCILVDDILGSGQTILNAISLLQQHKAKSIEVIISHNLMSSNKENLDRILAQVTRLSVSNSTSIDYSHLDGASNVTSLDKLNIVDISKSISNCLKSYFSFD